MLATIPLRTSSWDRVESAITRDLERDPNLDSYLIRAFPAPAAQP